MARLFVATPHHLHLHLHLEWISFFFFLPLLLLSPDIIRGLSSVRPSSVSWSFCLVWHLRRTSRLLGININFSGIIVKIDKSFDFAAFPASLLCPSFRSPLSLSFPVPSIYSVRVLCCVTTEELFLAIICHNHRHHHLRREDSCCYVLLEGRQMSHIYPHNQFGTFYGFYKMRRFIILSPRYSWFYGRGSSDAGPISP